MPDENVETTESAAVAEGAEVETPAKPADENLTGETAKPDPGDTPPKRKNWAQERINELTRQKHENERLAEHWRQVALARGGKETPAEKPQEKPKPKQEDFEDLESYLNARDEWLEDRAAKKAVAEYESRTKAAESKSEDQKQVDRFTASASEARGKYADYAQVLEAVDPNIPVSPEFHKAIMSKKDSGEFYYHLCKQSPEWIARVAGSRDPVEIGEAFAEVRAGIARPEQDGSDGEAKPEKPQTRAPNPPSLVRKASVGTKSFNPLDPSTWTDSKDYQKKMDEYEKKARS